jgi:hypothetical protein
VPGALVRVGGRYGHGDHVLADGERFLFPAVLPKTSIDSLLKNIASFIFQV